MVSSRPVRRLSCLVFLWTCLLAAPFALHAQDCLDYSDYWHFVGAAWIADANEVLVAGEYAYVADAVNPTGGLKVVDISDPMHPQIVGSVAASGTSRGLAKAGDHVYLANHWRMHVINVADPTDPHIVATVDPPNIAARDVAIYGQYAYLASGTVGVRVIDISDPNDPQEVGLVNTPDMAQSLTVVGRFGYVADGGSGLQILYLRFPQRPKIIGSIDTGSANAIAPASPFAANQFVYVADAENGLVVVDVSRPSQPTVAGSVDVQAYAEDVVISGRNAYVIDHERGLKIIDVLDPNNPQIILAVDAFTGMNSCTFDDGLVYLTGQGLLVLDAGHPAHPASLGSVSMPSLTRRFDIDDDYAFVLVGRNNFTLQTVDIATPSDPDLVQSTSVPIPAAHDATEIAVTASHAYVVHGDFNNGGGGLQIMDITDPLDPQVAGASSTPGVARGLAVDGGHVYIADEASLLVADVSNPDDPQIIGTAPTPGVALDVALAGDFAYVADSLAGVQVVDVTFPDTPQPVTAVPLPGSVCKVAAAGDHVYALSDLHGLQVLNVADPSDPQLVGAVDTPDVAGCGLAVTDYYAYVSDLGGIQIIDISTPSNPTIIGTASTPFAATDVAIAGNHMFVTRADDSNDGGLEVFWRQCANLRTPVRPAAVVLNSLTAYPNPFNPRLSLSFELPEPNEARLEVYDVRGSRVRVLLAGDWLAGGVFTTSWNGRDDRGRDLASGVYFARLRVGAEVLERKLVLLR